MRYESGTVRPFNPIWDSPLGGARAAAPTVRQNCAVKSQHRQICEAAAIRMLEAGVPLADIAAFSKLAVEAEPGGFQAIENKSNRALTSQEIDFRLAWPGHPEPQAATTVSRANVHHSAQYGEWPGAPDR